jgi:hypothetical protein
MHPINTIQPWLAQETALGSSSPNRIILATASTGAITSARVLAIREITEDRIIPALMSSYTLGGDSFSEVKRYIKMGGAWREEVVSP